MLHDLRDAPHAIEALLRAVNLNAALAPSWIMLERLYRINGEVNNAVAAAEHVPTLQHQPPEIVRAASLFSDGDLSENILRTYLRHAGNSVEALRLLARLEHQHGALDDAELRLEAALKLAPSYRAARLDYVRVLIDRQKYLPAHEMIHTLLKLEPGNREYLLLYAAACAGLGLHAAAIVAYHHLLAVSPRSSDLHVLHVLLGHSLKAIGRQKEAIESYQAAAAGRPGFGDAYWSLANLKTYRFSQDEIACMRVWEASPATDPVDRFHLCFALGKAYEDGREYAESWQFYERGNRLKRADGRYHPSIAETNTRQQMEVCTAQFFAERPGVGAPDPDPIFILGLPPFRIDTARADPRLPFAGRGHARTL
jgi:tetratricopeptide (TPR) repeat protein